MNHHAKRTHARGLRAEGWARLWLRLKGYQILAERFKTSFGEIDIVAKKNAVIAVVEVKARPSIRLAMEAVTPRAQARIIQAANAMLAFPGAIAPHLNGLETNLRFDVIAIRPWRLPHHLKDAWRP